jgi:peptide/nickel transport system permease protein
MPEEAQAKTQKKRMSLRRAILRELFRSPLVIFGLAVVLIVVILAIFAPQIAPYNPSQINFSAVTAPPSAAHLMGTDDVGRDILSRIIFGSRIDLMIGFLTICGAILIGLPLGAIAAYRGGWIDEVIMRLTDMFLSFPPLILAMALAAALGPGLIHAMEAMLITWWPWYTRLIRGQVLSLKENTYVEAARALGANDVRIILRHVLPNSLSPIIVQGTMDIGNAILTAASLSFIGLGAQPPQPEWGAMITVGRNYIQQYWWMATFPGLAILLTVIGFNLFGDGLRDSLDPRLR